MRNLTYLIFVALTFFCWGTYGPTLHQGQTGMGADGQLSLLRPIICVGIAYFLIAVLFPLAVLLTKGETGRWSIGGFWWSFIAGALGAFGALGITLAFKFEGKPIFVMPLVFGCAPIMNTLVTMMMAKTFRQANLMFFIGIGMVALGAAGVLLTKPAAKKTAQRQHRVEDFGRVAGDAFSSSVAPILLHASTRQEPETSESANKELALPGSDQPQQDPDSTPAVPAVSESSNQSSAPTLTPPTAGEPGKMKQALTGATNWLMVIAGIATTAICWGAYGPVLHRGQAKMAGSRLRPFLCVGLAYFAIAVVIPYWVLVNYPEPGAWLSSNGWLSRGAIWSLAAGALGALGALGIIYAFNFGGKPVFVMPLVFGFAPVINTLVETTSKGLLSEIKPLFYPSLGLVILGAIMVLVFAPKGGPKVAPKATE